MRRQGCLFQRGLGACPLCHGKRQQQTLSGDEAVTGLLSQLCRLFEKLGKFGRKIDLPAALDLGQLGQLLLNPLLGQRGIGAGGAQQVRGQTFAVVQQNQQQMFGGQALVVASQRQSLRGLNKATRAFRVAFKIHFLALFSPAFFRSAGKMMPNLLKGVSIKAAYAP